LLKIISFGLLTKKINLYNILEKKTLKYEGAMSVKYNNSSLSRYCMARIITRYSLDHVPSPYLMHQILGNYFSRSLEAKKTQVLAERKKILFWSELIENHNITGHNNTNTKNAQ
jgi:hypothetical protein